MKQTILGSVTSMAVVLAAVFLMAAEASAGGWAESSLDSVPTAEAGETVDVGFTIRQHGVTPINPEGEVGIVLRSKAGEEHFFAAEPVGDVGHHVAEVTFPDDGVWSLAVRQGWFAEQEFGPIEVALGPDPSAAGGYRGSGWIRFTLAALALGFAAAAAAGVTRSRRQRGRVLVT